MRKQCKSTRDKKDDSINYKDYRRFKLIAVGGHGSWDEPLDAGEIYDSASNKWTKIQKLPADFGIVCCGVICKGTFFVYSETDRLVGYDIERGYWVTNPNLSSASSYPWLLPTNGFRQWQAIFAFGFLV